VTLLRALVESFYSRAFYRRVAAEWGIGRAVVLLAFALALGWLVQVLALQRSFGAWAEGDGARFIESLPPLALRGGELEATPPGPHTIPLEESGGESRTLVIDTSEVPVPHREDVAVHVTRTTVSARRNAFETRSFEIPEVVKALEREDGPISPEELRAALSAIALWLPLFLYPVVVVGELAYRVVAALALAAIGLVLGRVLGAGLEFGRLFVVSLVVLAPLVLAESLLSAFGQPVSGWVAAPVAVAILAFALRAAAAPRPDAQQPGLPPPFGG